MNELMEKIKSKAKSPDTYRYLLFIVFLYMMIYAGIGFMNAGNSYEQAYSLRLFCIGFGILVLVMMDVKQWFTIWSLLYIPLCYVFTHFAYEKHWIEDICEYQFVDIIRQGKMVILIWGLVLIAIIRDLIKNKGWKKWKTFQPLLAVVWLLFIVFLTLFKRDYFYASVFIISYSAYFYVNSNPTRRELLWKAMLNAAVLSLFYVIYKSMIHRPYDCERYTTYFVNANMAGMYLACMVAVLFTKLNLWWAKTDCAKGIKVTVLIFYYLLMGFTCGLVLFNYTRTTILGIGFAFLTLLILQLVKEKRKLFVLLRYGILVLVAAALFQVTYQVIRYVPAYINEPSYFSGEYNPDTRIMKDDPVDSPKYTTMESFLTLALGKWGIYVEFADSSENGQGSVEVDTNRDVTNGRTEIWKTYLARTNWTGHYPGHILMDSGYFCYHAHSTYFHVLYQYGLLCGIVYALMIVGAYVFAIVCYLRTRQANFMIFAVLITGINLIGQITEWMGHPAYVICMMLFFTYGMLLMEKKNER